MDEPPARTKYPAKMMAAIVETSTSCISWVPQSLTNDGAGHYTFTLSSLASNPFGLAISGEQLEFLFVLGGVEYKGGTGVAISQGVSVSTKALGVASFVPATVYRDAVTGNTYIMVP